MVSPGEAVAIAAQGLEYGCPGPTCRVAAPSPALNSSEAGSKTPILDVCLRLRPQGKDVRHKGLSNWVMVPLYHWASCPFNQPASLVPVPAPVLQPIIGENSRATMIP